MRKFLVAVLAVAALVLFATVAVYAQVPEDSVLSGEQCKMCHPEEYDVWASTAHPKSIDAVKSSDHASESCLHCMSADYRWDESLTVETFKYGVTCVACHAPHETPGDALPAIEDVSATCKDCHNAHLEEGATGEPGSTLRHSVKEMFGGYGAIDAEGAPSVHEMACNTCHLQGHLYVPEQSTCDTCHGGAVTIEESGAAIRTLVEETGALENLSDKWPAAYTNYTLLSNDDSGGIHNMAYASAIAAAIETQLAAEPLPVPEPEPVEPEPPAEVPTTGGSVDPSAVLVLSGFLSLVSGMGAYVWSRRK